MFYPSTAGSVTSFVHPAHYPVSRSYYPTAPMSAVIPGQHYYPAMHGHHHAVAYPATAAPVMMQPSYGVPAYYGQQPTVIVSSRSGRHRHSRSRSRSRGFLGYL
ncbi:hypothetical protein D9613_009553 [Agrocybe pediades]|uniref:Uncharacterized protein n=1 Tax=Agrocybe pediades TaxID=84607 RepID=A0A8H4R3U9_9AGAR|nr:hypothetical protein D9613_009553 [Agrocybe pediades]